MANNEQEPKPGDVWWCDCLHLNDAMEIFKKSRNRETNPWCTYVVPGKNRPVIVLFRPERDIFWVVMSTSAEKCGRAKKSEMNLRNFNRRYLEIGDLLEEGKQSLLETSPEKTSKKLFRRKYKPKETLSPLEFGPILKEFQAMALFGRSRS